MKPKLRIGLIGSGFMGKAHTFGFATAAKVFDLPYDVQLATLADISTDAAEAARAAFGFEAATGNWRDLLADPSIDVIDITAPNGLHKEMALEAIAAGKHVYCEKPLAPRASEARRMAEAAEAAGVKTQVGFNYICNPIMRLARDMISGGELGIVLGYRGIHAEDYMTDPDAPYTFRHDPAGGGALADLGSHALATAEFLLGPISRVMGDCVTVCASRPDGRGGRTPVSVDDVTRAFLRFECGVSGSIEANWMSTGHKMQHDFEVYGTQGSLAFTGEHLNVLHFYSCADPAGRQGYRRIEAAPEHVPYGRFCVAPGHQIGFNDIKAVEIAGYLDAIAGKVEEPFNFRAGHRIQSLVELIHRSSDEECWLDVDVE